MLPASLHVHFFVLTNLTSLKDTCSEDSHGAKNKMIRNRAAMRNGVAEDVDMYRAPDLQTTRFLIKLLATLKLHVYSSVKQQFALRKYLKKIQIHTFRISGCFVLVVNC